MFHYIFLRLVFTAAAGSRRTSAAAATLFLFYRIKSIFFAAAGAGSIKYSLGFSTALGANWFGRIVHPFFNFKNGLTLGAFVVVVGHG